jgi:hypothetical protein
VVKLWSICGQIVVNCVQLAAQFVRGSRSGCVTDKIGSGPGAPEACPEALEPGPDDPGQCLQPPGAPGRVFGSGPRPETPGLDPSGYLPDPGTPGMAVGLRWRSSRTRAWSGVCPGVPDPIATSELYGGGASLTASGQGVMDIAPRGPARELPPRSGICWAVVLGLKL